MPNLKGTTFGRFTKLHNMSTVYLILKEDIIDFPPVLSILHVLSNTRYKVIHMGTYSDNIGKKALEDDGVEFVPMPHYDGASSLPKKMWQQIKFRKKVSSYLKRAKLSNNDDLVWLIQAETIYLLSTLVKKYRTICHFFEFADTKVSWKYRALNPFIDLSDVLQHAYKVVCCEYNRAQIAKGIFQLTNIPIILPNKIIFNERDIENIPEDVSHMVETVRKKVEGKKVILYQGIFLDKERRLEEFCETTNDLPQDFVFIAMGKGSNLYEQLKKKYESDRILFIPFVRPPYHLLITKMASIGVLSYFPRPGSIGRTLNPLYCAPNKIFEYSKFGIPMISNDVPALKFSFMEYHCGECIKYPMTKEAISNTIKKIIDNYQEYSNGAVNYYNSVNPEDIIMSIVE